MAKADEEFGKRLVVARESRKMTAPEAATALRIPYPTYKSHENGSRGGRKSAERYAQFFRVNYLWLSIGKGPMDADPIQRAHQELPPQGQRELTDFVEFLRQKYKKAAKTR